LTSRLKAGERSILRAAAEAAAGRENIVALCAFGSRVSGSTRAGSDYNLLVVVKGFKGGAAPAQPKARPGVSALVVDEEEVREEARASSTKEFVVGRLLNIYEPLVGADFLRSVELEYKRRVISEALTELQSEYGGFSSDLIIPYEYFLFDKLRKRISVYPDITGPLARTYSGRFKKENVEFAVRGFREAIGPLAASGTVEATDQSVRILPGKVPTDVASKIAALISPTKDGTSSVKASGRDVLTGTRNPASKTRAGRKRRDLAADQPIELERPRKLLRLEEGVIFDDASKITEELARISGFLGSYDFKQRKKGESYTATQLLEISTKKGEKAEFILKSFPELRTVKWALLNLWAFTGKKFRMTPFAMLQREYEGVFRLRKLGIRTHRIVGIAPDEKILVTRFVSGVPLSKVVGMVTDGAGTDTRYIAKYAKTLAKMHKDGLVYGDTKAENVIISQGEISLFDLEQTVEDGDPAWDLAEFLYFSGRSAKTDEGMKLVADSFLSSYREECGTRTIAKAKGVRYLLPFQPFLQPGITSVIRNSLERHSSPSGAG
jgi:tRNA A-37 threonylcarbamoyl transferase component Bud32/predicted nucleotidyltransferase